VVVALARYAGARGEPECVLLLAAALRSLGRELGVPVAVTRLAALEAVETAYRDELDAETAARAAAAGEAMTVESLREYLASLE